MKAMTTHCAVITVSNRASRGVYEDRSGPAAHADLSAAGFAVADVVVVPDDDDQIVEAITSAIDAGARIVLTTGGTGIHPDDRTPEATATLGGQELPGIIDAIRARGAATVVQAALTRGLAVAVHRGERSALVVNAPGSVGGSRDAVAVLVPLIPHVIAQLDGGDH